MSGEGDEARIGRQTRGGYETEKTLVTLTRFGVGQLRRRAPPREGLSTGESGADGCAGREHPRALDMLARCYVAEDALQELAREEGQAKVEGPL